MKHSSRHPLPSTAAGTRRSLLGLQGLEPLDPIHAQSLAGASGPLLEQLWMPPPPRFPRVFQSPLLQPPLHKLFVPRPMPDILPPPDLYLDGYSGPRITSVAPYIEALNEQVAVMPSPSPVEAKLQREEAKKENARKAVEEGLEAWKPQENPEATSDPIKTLFVGRLAYDTTERQLRREFEIYGEISEVKMVVEKASGKPKGYAFIQFASEDEMKAAFRDADAKKINGRRIVVDVERGRTVKGWKPRRLGGGLGRTRVGGPKQNQKYSGRDPTLASEASGRRTRERSASPDRYARHRDTQSYRHRR